MANLLSKLRINYASLTMLHGVSDKPQSMTTEMHERMVNRFMSDQTSPDTIITQAEKDSLQEKTNRQLRLRELLLEHSNNASLIVMSMPMPRQGTISAPLYMSWLEMLTRDMPPFVLVRGNQTSVLSFNA
jgi:solute carrier family 12 sodium/potassium/chloride transporter 2